MSNTAESGGGLVFKPLEQFEIKPLFGHGPVEFYTITNLTLWMALGLLVAMAIFVYGSRGRALVPSRLQSVGELGYGFVHNMIEEVTGHDGVKYFPYIMTLFIFVRFG